MNLFVDLERKLPEAIWWHEGRQGYRILRGTPEEMMRSMLYSAAAVQPTLETVVQQVLHHLQNKGIEVSIAPTVPTARQPELVIRTLLTSGFAKPCGQALSFAFCPIGQRLLDVGLCSGYHIVFNMLPDQVL